MKKIFIFLFLILQTLPAFAQTSGAPVWQKISMGVLEAHFDSLTTSSVTPRILFLDSQDSLYRTLDEGRHWSQIFKLPGDLKSQIHRVYTSPHQSDTVYLATSEGLFVSHDLGGHFELLFSSAETKERDCYSLAFHPMDSDILFLGTGNGFFWTLDAGETWNRLSAEFNGGEIIKIIPDETDDRSFLILTPSSLFSLNEKNGGIKTLYTLPAGSEPRDPGEEFPEETREKINRINDFVLIPDQDGKILLATETGILENSGGSGSWASFPMHGLKSNEIMKIVAADSGRIFMATRQGVYWFIAAEKRWEELKNGLDQTDSKDIAFHPSAGGTLYTVTSSGVFKLSLPGPIEIETVEIRSVEIRAEDLNLLRDYLTEEPDLRAIHHAAIRYADMNPEKIKNWQRESRLSHLMPKLSGGVSNSIDQNIDIDRGSTNNPDLFIIGPNEKSWSHNVGISWDFAELIWSSDQTSIDSRSKLMTELRNEILSSLTRLYFERKRLITEYFLKPPSDELSRIELIQHIEELTAHIDAYTGGYFSDEMERRNVKQPWEESS